MALDQAVPLRVCLEVIRRLDEANPGLGCEVGRDSCTEFWVRVDAAAHGGASGRELDHRIECSAGSFHRQGQLPGLSADLLSQPQRSGVGQVSASDLDHLVPLVSFSSQ